MPNLTTAEALAALDATLRRKLAEFDREVAESLVDAESTRINPWRERGDDDGLEYADPRDAQDERRGL